MSKCLGYYGAGDKASHDINYDGTAPTVNDEQRAAIEKAVAEVIPELKNLSERDRRAVTKWVINEGF